MSFIRFAVAGLALCASASAATAQGTAPSGATPGQGGPQGGIRGRGMQARLFDGITLTEEQKKKIDDLRAARQASRNHQAPSGAQGAAVGETARAKRAEMMDKQNAEIRAILTAEQRLVFDKNVAEMKKRREQMRSQDRT